MIFGIAQYLRVLSGQGWDSGVAYKHPNVSAAVRRCVSSFTTFVHLNSLQLAARLTELRHTTTLSLVQFAAQSYITKRKH